MAQRRMIPKPRHLFPEIAAMIISIRRSLLYAGVGSRALIGSIPPWIVGSLAGIASMMLTISLFFMVEETTVVAAPQTIQPIVLDVPDLSSLNLGSQRIEPIDTPTITPPPLADTRRTLPQLSIEADFAPSEIPLGQTEWRFSSLPQLPAIPTNTNPGPWRAFTSRQFSGNFSPYIAQALKLDEMNFRQLTAQPNVPLQYAPNSGRTLGVLLAKPSRIIGAPNEPITYEIELLNFTNQTLDQLEVRERISELTRVTNVSPRATTDNGDLVWVIDDFQAGASRRFSITIVPEIAGEITSRTTILPASLFSKGVLVSAAPETPVPPPVTPTPPATVEPPPIQTQPPGRPELSLTYTPLPNLNVDDNLTMTFSVTNIGTADAVNIELFVRLSDEFEHRYGEYVHHRIDRLSPGQTRRAFLAAIARKSGSGLLSTSLRLNQTEVDARSLRIAIAPTETVSNVATPAAVTPVVYVP